MEVTQVAAAKATGIPQSCLSEILSGRRSITADTAARRHPSPPRNPKSTLG
jgi:plasmid maintenance system antidote protein VapI